MKNEYEKLNLEVIEFETEDVIATSDKNFPGSQDEDEID